MGNTRQAPKIKYVGEKFQDLNERGKAIRTHDLEQAIMTGLGDRDFAAVKIMFYLTGNAEGWGVSEADIFNRCKISKKSYLDSRKKLSEMGWVTLDIENNLCVNYDKIYSVLGESKVTPKKEEELPKNLGDSNVTPKLSGSEVTSILGSSEVSSKLSGSEVTTKPEDDFKKLWNGEVTSKLSSSEVTPILGGSEVTPKKEGSIPGQENPYNCTFGGRIF